MVTCPKCGTNNSSKAMNCSQCHVNLEWAQKHLDPLGRELPKLEEGSRQYASPPSPPPTEKEIDIANKKAKFEECRIEFNNLALTKPQPNFAKDQIKQRRKELEEEMEKLQKELSKSEKTEEIENTQRKCPKCGTVNDVGATNCRNCRVNLKFALEQSGEIDRLEEMKREDKQKEMPMGIVRLNIERSKEVTWPDRCPACDAAFGEEERATFALKAKKNMKVWLSLCSRCSKRVRRAEIVSNLGYGFVGLVFLLAVVGFIHPGAAAAFWAGAIIGWLGNKKKKSIIGVRIIEASPEALTLWFKNKTFASDFLSANEGTLPEKRDKEVHAEKGRYQKQVQKKERLEQTRILGRKISIHRGVGIAFVGIGGLVLLILFLISLSMISKGEKIGTIAFFIIVICMPLIIAGIVHFRRARRLRQELEEMQQIRG